MPHLNKLAITNHVSSLKRHQLLTLMNLASEAIKRRTGRATPIKVARQQSCFPDAKGAFSVPLVHIVRSSRTVTFDLILTSFSVHRVRSVLRRS